MHNLTISNERAEMAYVGETPWHGLGQKLTEGANLETWATEAGMAWRVQRSKVRFAVERDGDETKFQTWNDRHVLFRSDTKAPLGLVSDRYKVVQPLDVLKFFHDVAEQNGLALETAGTLGGGTKYWALARINREINLGGADTLKPYAMLATSADGSMNTIGKLITTRIVCQNTMNMALGEKGEAIKVRHSTTFRAEDVRMDMGLVAEEIDRYEQTIAKLASKRFTKQMAVEVLVKAIGGVEAFGKAFQEKGAVKAFAEQPNARPMGAILELFDGGAMGANLITSDHTGWGLVNAATQYFDHSAGRSQDTRLQSAWFGENNRRKDRILEEALVLI